VALPRGGTGGRAPRPASRGRRPRPRGDRGPESVRGVRSLAGVVGLRAGARDDAGALHRADPPGGGRVPRDALRATPGAVAAARGRRLGEERDGQRRRLAQGAPPRGNPAAPTGLRGAGARRGAAAAARDRFVRQRGHRRVDAGARGVLAHPGVRARDGQPRRAADAGRPGRAGAPLRPYAGGPGRPGSLRVPRGRCGRRHPVQRAGPGERPVPRRRAQHRLGGRRCARRRPHRHPRAGPGRRRRVRRLHGLGPGLGRAARHGPDRGRRPAGPRLGTGGRRARRRARLPVGRNS
jgi:hypothetical protein